MQFFDTQQNHLIVTTLSFGKPNPNVPPNPTAPHLQLHNPPWIDDNSEWFIFCVDISADLDEWNDLLPNLYCQVGSNFWESGKQVTCVKDTKAKNGQREKNV